MVLLIGLSAVVVLAWMVRSVLRARRGLRTYRSVMLSHQGPCGTCGYDLRGNPADRCPECGTPSRWNA